ncbi:MAG: TetR family transcriptional regulator [Methanobacterium paludis]|nr:TetR family transcriptional regulator [Methanobacterium paludis]
METAFKLFLKKGFADVSLNEIIRESDITSLTLHILSFFSPRLIHG